MKSAVSPFKFARLPAFVMVATQTTATGDAEFGGGWFLRQLLRRGEIDDAND
jgi:hypothetical protein